MVIFDMPLKLSSLQLDAAQGNASKHPVSLFLEHCAYILLYTFFEPIFIEPLKYVHPVTTRNRIRENHGKSSNRPHLSGGFSEISAFQEPCQVSMWYDLGVSLEFPECCESLQEG